MNVWTKFQFCQHSRYLSKHFTTNATNVNLMVALKTKSKEESYKSVGHIQGTLIQYDIMWKPDPAGGTREKSQKSIIKPTGGDLLIFIL